MGPADLSVSQHGPPIEQALPCCRREKTATVRGLIGHSLRVAKPVSPLYQRRMQYPFSMACPSSDMNFSITPLHNLEYQSTVRSPDRRWIATALNLEAQSLERLTNGTGAVTNPCCRMGHPCSSQRRDACFRHRRRGDAHKSQPAAFSGRVSKETDGCFGCECQNSLPIVRKSAEQNRGLQERDLSTKGKQSKETCPSSARACNSSQYQLLGQGRGILGYG